MASSIFAISLSSDLDIFEQCSEVDSDDESPDSENNRLRGVTWPELSRLAAVTAEAVAEKEFTLRRVKLSFGSWEVLLVCLLPNIGLYSRDCNCLWHSFKGIGSIQYVGWYFGGF